MTITRGSFEGDGRIDKRLQQCEEKGIPLRITLKTSRAIAHFEGKMLPRIGSTLRFTVGDVGQVDIELLVAATFGEQLLDSPPSIALTSHDGSTVCTIEALSQV